MKNINLIFYCVLFLFSTLTTHCQTFEKYYHTSLDDRSSDAIELNNGSYLIVINRGDYFTQFGDFLLLNVDSTGQFIDSLVYNSSDNYNYFGVAILYSINDSVYICTRVCEDENEFHYFNIIKFDNNFNTILDTIVGSTIADQYIFYYLLTFDNKIVINVSETVNNSFYLYEYDLFIDSLSYHPIIDTGGLIYQWPVITHDIPDINRYQVYMFDAYKTIFGVNRINYTIEETYSYFPDNFLPKTSVNGFNDSTYLVAGQLTDYSSGDVRFIPAFFEIDFQGNLLSYNEIDLQNDTSTYLTGKCFVTSSDRIYIAETYNYTNIPPFTIIPEQRWIWLMCLYPDGTLDWQRFYKGEVNYMPYKLLPTNDGGLLIVSNKYDWNDPVPYQRDVHILKVDSTGWYQGLTTGLPEQTKENQILVYPNPASDYVHFAFGYYSNLQIAIYSSQGQQVFTGQFAKKATIDISLLPAGIYTYTINNDNGFFERGKIIKQ